VSVLSCAEDRLLRVPPPDLCVSAALDAVKEHVTVPWATGKSSPAAKDSPISATPPKEEEAPEDAAPADGESTPRVLRTHNFAKALQEITPSASEALGTLADLRKWNAEFGEGRADKKRVQVWGRGSFGFTVPRAPGEDAVAGGVKEQ
jgi:hypothetical protein